MIHSLHLDSFYLSEEQLENSPSRQDGIDKDTEANLRMYGCEIIQEAGIMLAFDQVVMATGQVLLHRFYCKRSMKTFNVKKLAATALWVAAKLEEVRVVREHPRKLLEMVMVAVDRSITRRETPEGRKLAVLDTHSKEGEEFRRALIRYESEMLKAFGFIMNVEHPHRLLCNYCQILFAPYMDKPDKQGFLQTFIQESWNVANDSLRTTLCVRFKGSVVACGIIFYTARRLQVPLPDNWWELFMVKLEHICDVCRILHELYLAPKPSFVPVCHQLLPSKPPTPAVAGGAAVKGAGVTATPTPMLGATPELNTRPGGKPLDPSVRRTLPASESTPNLAAATAAPANGAAAGSALPSPEGAPAPGSARKRSRSPSPRSPAGDNRKRQQLDSSMQPAAGATELQLQEKAREAIAAAGKAPLSRPRSNAGSDRDGDHRDRGYDRGSRRDRPRSRSRDRSRRSRSRSRDRRRSRSRDRSRRSRSRDRKRSRSRDKGRRSRSRSRDRRRTSRSRSRDRRRERDYKDSRSGSVRDSRDRTDRDRADKGREVPRSPAKPDKQQQQEPRYPSPPAEPAASASPGKGAGDTAAAAAPAGGGDGSKEQRGSKPNGVGSSNGSEQEPQPGKPTAGGSATADDRAALPPKAKPRAVRKQHPSGAAASPVDSPNAAGDAAPGPQAAGTD